MLPTVSVIIPAYNRATTIRRAIDSVLSQTHQGFEIIVIDDGSTDATADIVAAIEDPRLRLIRHDRRRGGSAARNTGIREGSAPFVAFLDSDDEWLASKLERQLEIFERSDEHLALVYTGAVWLYPDGAVDHVVARRYADLAHRLLTVNVIGETSLGMVRRTALNEIGGFDETLPSCQDMDVWLRLCERFEADIVAEPLVRVTKGDDQGRISNNVAAAMKGRALFCEKHRHKMVSRRVLHLYLRMSARWQHRRVRDSHLARRLYIESLRANPIAPYTYVLLAAACLPMGWVDVMAAFRQRIAGVVGRGRAAITRHSNSPASIATTHQRRSTDSSSS